MRRTCVGFAAAACLAMAFAGPAAARTWTVWTGEQTKPPADAPKSATLNQFFPAVLKINVGDKVRFVNQAFHTVTFMPSHEADHPVVLPDPDGGKYGVPNDAGGAPFYFNGLMKFIFNPEVFGPVGSSVVAEEAEHNSGVFGRAAGRVSVTFTFPEAGTYTYHCAIHPGMKGKIVVRPKEAAVLTPAAVKAKAASQTAAAWARAKVLESSAVPANTVYAGIGKNTTLLAFLPKTLTVPVGTLVTFVNMAPSEIHNMVWGPSDWLKPFLEQTELFPQGPGSPNQVQPFWIYGSDPPPFTYDGASHGNGVYATPLLDDQPGDPPQGLPQSLQVTFTKPGTYHYFCLVHGVDMSGDIVVTG